MRLLLIDYNENELKVNGDMFEACGHQVDFASSAHIALAKVKMNNYDAVVTEINLPNDSGMWLLKRLSDIRSHLPVIILTDGISLSRVVQAFRLNTIDVIQKPLDFNKLMSIQEILENNRSNGSNGSGNPHDLTARLDELRKTVESIGREFNLKEVEVLDLLKQNSLVH